MTFNASRFFRLLLVASVAWASLPAQQTQHVVIIVIDGTRYSETFGDSTHANIPLLWNQLRPLGTLYTSFWNDGITMTNSGHASILCGTRETLKNNGTELPHSPTLFEYCRKQTGAPANQCWVALGKTKLQMLSFSDHKGYGSRYGASVRTSSSEYDNSIAQENTTSLLATYHPKLLIVNIPAADEFAHDSLRDKYVGAIRQADTIVAAIWKVIQADSLLHGTTTMIVTNDHGRHTTDYTDHGDACEGCRHIMLLIIGPGTPAGMIDPTMHKQIDIAPTVGALLRFKTPYSVGVTIESAVARSGR